MYKEGRARRPSTSGIDLTRKSPYKMPDQRGERASHLEDAVLVQTYRLTTTHTQHTHTFVLIVITITISSNKTKQ